MYDVVTGFCGQDASIDHVSLSCVSLQPKQLPVAASVPLATDNNVMHSVIVLPLFCHGVRPSPVLDCIPLKTAKLLDVAVEASIPKYARAAQHIQLPMWLAPARNLSRILRGKVTQLGPWRQDDTVCCCAAPEDASYATFPKAACMTSLCVVAPVSIVATWPQLGLLGPAVVCACCFKLQAKKCE